MQLEDDCLPSPSSHKTVQVVGGLATLPGVAEGTDTLVFFKPVDNNMSHLTFLGSGVHDNFDFVAQVFSVASYRKEGNHDTEVVLGMPSGPPQAMRLSDKTYDVLSRKLMIWSSTGQTMYQVQKRIDMYHGATTWSLFFNIIVRGQA